MFTFQNKATAVKAPETEQGSDTTRPDMASNIDGDALASAAAALAAKLSNETQAAVIETVEFGEKAKGGIFRTMFGMVADYGPDLIEAGFAVPDSEEGNNPDHFQIEKLNAKGERVKVWTTFYRQFALSSAAGKSLSERIEWTERAGTPNAIKTDVPADIMAMTPVQRETHKNFLNGRLGTITKQYRDAAKLCLQFKAVKEYPGVDAEPLYVEGKGMDDVSNARELEVENTPKPIQVWLKPAEGKPVPKWEALSIGAFLKLNPAKGIEKGGTFQNLIESGIVKKKPGQGVNSGGGKDDGVTIKTLDKGVGVIAELHRWLVDEVYRDKTKAEIGKFYKLMNTKDNDELITAMVELRNAFTEICKDTGADAKYVALQQKGSELVTGKAA